MKQSCVFAGTDWKPIFFLVEIDNRTALFPGINEKRAVYDRPYDAYVVLEGFFSSLLDLNWEGCGARMKILAVPSQFSCVQV